MEKQVIIESYNPDWLIAFDQEKEKIQKLLNGKVIAIEHIGSTSVKGLGAKPTLDMMAGVEKLEEVDHFIEPLQKLGNEFVHHDAFPERRFFRKGEWGSGTHHLHFYKYKSETWINQLLFRDYLRNHPKMCRQYHELKKELAERYRYDRPAYTKAKASFIQIVFPSRKRKVRVNDSSIGFYLLIK